MGSLAALVAATPCPKAAQPAGQIPHWLFGYDAAAIATYSALALLASHPEHADRVHTEIDSIEPNRPATADAPPLLRACTLESLRLWPTSLAILRDTTAETTWHDGTTTPPDTGVVFYSSFFHRAPQHLPHADEFEPDSPSPRRPHCPTAPHHRPHRPPLRADPQVAAVATACRPGAADKCWPGRRRNPGEADLGHRQQGHSGGRRQQAACLRSVCHGTRPAIASRTAGPIITCPVSGGIQETCPGWPRLSHINGDAHATATMEVGQARTQRTHSLLGAHTRTTRCRRPSAAGGHVPQGWPPEAASKSQHRPR
ncbi:cytochrome P450 [Streptomyces sp. NPDC048506]|uniref:cytochrome P450 n=1 Tax=Streptomyces sp. NPDC048506 TaxID=3155028 RepID=UPI0034277D4D